MICCGPRLSPGVDQIRVYRVLSAEDGSSSGKSRKPDTLSRDGKLFLQPWGGACGPVARLSPFRYIDYLGLLSF
jgi:hypothetical protein